jgi:hypothetical protein
VVCWVDGALVVTHGGVSTRDELGRTARRFRLHERHERHLASRPSLEQHEGRGSGRRHGAAGR